MPLGFMSGWPRPMRALGIANARLNLLTVPSASERYRGTCFFWRFVRKAAFGFPCALMLAWAFDLTSKGIQRTSIDGAVRVSSSVRQIWALGIVSTLIAALALSAYWFWHPWAHPSAGLSQANGAIPEKSIA